MADDELTDIMFDMEFGELTKGWIEDWSDDENSDCEDWSENGDEWEDLNVSGIIMLSFFGGIRQDYIFVLKIYRWMSMMMVRKTTRRSRMKITLVRYGSGIFCWHAN